MPQTVPGEQPDRSAFLSVDIRSTELIATYSADGDTIIVGDARKAFALFLSRQSADLLAHRLDDAVQDAERGVSSDG